MSDELEYEVEIVDDQSTPIDDLPVGGEVDDRSAEQKAEDQAKSEQEAEANRGERLTGKQRRSKLRERVDELTRKYRDEERERLRIQQERDQEREQFQHQTRQFQEAQVDSARLVYSTLSESKRLLESNLEIARNRGDTQTENRIQDKLTETRDRLTKLKHYYPGVDSEQPSQGTQQPAQPQPQPARQQWDSPYSQPAQPQAETGQRPAQGELPSAAKDWIDTNGFLKERQDLHPLINNINNLLVAKGMDNSKPEFYQELTKRLKAELPEDVAGKLREKDDFDSLLGDDDDDGDDDDSAQADAGQQARQDQAPAPGQGQRQAVADAGRTPPRTAGNKRKVKLTRDEMAFADRMGISREDYAKQKIRQESATGYTVIGE